MTCRSPEGEFFLWHRGEGGIRSFMGRPVPASSSPQIHTCRPELTPSPNLSNEVALQRLTNALIIHPIAGGVALLAFIFGLIGIFAASRIATILMALFSAIAAVAALVIFVIDMVLWILVRNRVRDSGNVAELVSSALQITGG